MSGICNQLPWVSLRGKVQWLVIYVYIYRRTRALAVDSVSIIVGIDQQTGRYA